MDGEKTENQESLSDEAETELAGVPESMRDDGDESDAAEQVSDADRIAELEEALATARHEVLYAKAEEQNTRRRLEQEKQNASAYAATGFSREILSVADNLERALEAVPQELREDEKFKGLVAGLDATGRELTTIFSKHGIEPVNAVGEELDLVLDADDPLPGCACRVAVSQSDTHAGGFAWFCEFDTVGN